MPIIPTISQTQSLAIMECLAEPGTGAAGAAGDAGETGAAGGSALKALERTCRSATVGRPTNNQQRADWETSVVKGGSGRFRAVNTWFMLAIEISCWLRMVIEG